MFLKLAENVDYSQNTENGEGIQEDDFRYFYKSVGVVPGTTVIEIKQVHSENHQDSHKYHINYFPLNRFQFTHDQSNLLFRKFLMAVSR
jgi:hypothetical protein